MRRAFIIVGPESSGTKLVTELFIRIGCVGDSSHYQPFDSIPVVDIPSDVVFRRSVPHGGEFFAPEEVKEKFENYFLFWVIVVRDWMANYKSAPKYGHKKNEREAKSRLPMEWIWIAERLTNMTPFYFINTSYLFVKPERVLRSLSDWTGLDFTKLNYDFIFDADKKYFEEAEI